MQRENKITSIYTLNILKMSIQWKSTKDESSKKALLQWWCINPLHIQPTKELNFSPLIGEECQNPDPFPFFFFFFLGGGQNTIDALDIYHAKQNRNVSET